PRTRRRCSRNSARWARTAPARARVPGSGSRSRASSWSFTAAGSGWPARSARARPSPSPFRTAHDLARAPIPKETPTAICEFMQLNPSTRGPERRVAMDRREVGRSRREFLEGLTLAGAAALLSLKSEPAAAEPPPEVTRIRIQDAPLTCFAPVYLADGLL